MNIDPQTMAAVTEAVARAMTEEHGSAAGAEAVAQAARARLATKLARTDSFWELTLRDPVHDGGTNTGTSHARHRSVTSTSFAHTPPNGRSTDGASNTNDVIVPMLDQIGKKKNDTSSATRNSRGVTPACNTPFLYTEYVNEPTRPSRPAPSDARPTGNHPSLGSKRLTTD